MPVESTPTPVESMPPSGEVFRCAVPTTCQPPSAWSQDPWPATIRDISTTAVHLTLNRRFERGSGMAIELPGADGAFSTVLARVAEVRTLTSGTWLLVCTFVSELADDEVRHVLSFATRGDLAEPNLNAPTVNGVLFQARLPSGELLRWYVKRLELAGTWPLPPGKTIAMRVGGLARDTALVELCVRHCTQHGSSWVIDGEFIATPADRVLAALTASPKRR